MNAMRIDKWLWAARFFKTRALAARSCDLGRVLWNGQAAKPAREMKVGDLLQVTNEGGVFAVEVLALSEMRGPAAVAQSLYRESEASIAARAKVKEERKLLAQWEVFDAGGRPTKKDRRTLQKSKGRIIRFGS